MRAAKDPYEVELRDVASSPWSDVDLIGEKLSREAAPAHRWKATAFEILDETLERDPSLRGFLRRAQCGDSTAPLERNFQAPDEIFALGRYGPDSYALAKVEAALKQVPPSIPW